MKHVYKCLPHFCVLFVILLIYCICRWALFPPHTPKEILKVPTTLGGKQRDEAISWFAHVYPQTQLSTWPKDCKPVSQNNTIILLGIKLEAREKRTNKIIENE